MELRVLQQVKVRMPEGPQIFTPGQTIDLPEPVALRLVDLAGGKIQRQDQNTPLTPGVWCEWWSPMFGHCTGQIKQVTVSGYIVTHSSVIGPHEQIEIPVAWLCGVYREQ